MIDDQLNYLRSHQEELAMKLLRHCCILATQNYGWHQDKALPLGKFPDLLVCEVLADYFEGRRHFNEEFGVETQLKNAVRSELSALHRRKESHAIPFKTGDDDNAPRDFAADGAQPDQAAMNAHDTNVLFELYAAHPKVKGDEELELLLIAIQEGADDTPAMVKATGIPEKRVYELRRSLRTLYPTILRQFQQELQVTK